jgi:hypothetical protein
MDTVNKIASIIANNKWLFIISMSILWLFLTDEERDEIRNKIVSKEKSP